MSFRLQSDLLCPICHDVFQEPVILGCSHSFCQRCLELHWKQRDDRLCPLWKSWAPRTICSLHSKTFKLFCLDQQQLACVVCRDSEQHTHHSFRPVDEAAVDQRDALQTALKPLRRRLADVQLAGQKLQRTAEDLEVQARNTERRMKETYEKLRRFLAEDEKERMAFKIKLQTGLNSNRKKYLKVKLPHWRKCGVLTTDHVHVFFENVTPVTLAALKTQNHKQSRKLSIKHEQKLH
uniref:Uncharacterized protein n=1 Tax=Salarias fasciatus TaxID=181472 RepID=A0A672IT67_SALFA